MVVLSELIALSSRKAAGPDSRSASGGRVVGARAGHARVSCCHRRRWRQETSCLAVRARRR